MTEYLVIFLNFTIITLGCKVNQYESELMDELLCQNGYTRAEDHKDADICIVNSCTVTATGDSKNRKVIHRIRRENPNAIIVLCGCMPQAFKDDLDTFSECDIVLGNTLRRDVLSAIEEYLMTRTQIIRINEHERGEAFEPMRIKGFSSRTRAYIKIEDGCNRFCTYCIIPYARGRVRSKTVEDLTAEAKDLAAAGFKEIVLVGINLSAYGSDIGLDITDAVHAVCGIEGIERVRLGSIEPERMDEEVLKKLAAEKKFCPHFHLSLQSGCTATLKRMHRHYTAEEYDKIVSDIRRYFENPSITTDVMVGFVGETDEEFADSLAFCDRIGFAKTHVFAYSRRKGTAADKMDGQIPESVKRERSSIMIEHMLAKENAFMQSQVGTVASVLFETTSNGWYEGYSDNYTKVKVRSDDDLSGMIFPVKLTKACDDHCVGELFR